MEKTPQALKTDIYRWDLSIMYKGITDPQIDKDVDKLSGLYEKFNREHKDKLAQTLGQALRDFMEIDMLENKIWVYFELVQSLDETEQVIKSKIATVQLALSRVYGEYMTFFDIELVNLSDDVLEKWYSQDELVAKHRPWINQERIFKPHMLSEPVESALAKRSPFGSSAWSDFFNEVAADLRVPFNGKELTVTEAKDIMVNSKDAAARAEALKAINDAFDGKFAKYSAQNLYAIVGSDSVEDRERKYAHPMDGRNKENQIPDKVVETLHHSVIDKAAPLARRYYKLKAAHMGLKNLKWSDRNAPLPFNDNALTSFGEALKIAETAYRSFSPTLADLIKEMIKNNCIDAPAVKNKHSGAYNASMVLPGDKPESFTLLNYLGSSDDISILAHELGHGVHGLISAPVQGPLMFHPALAYCETASVFGEMVTFNFLKEKLAQRDDTKAELALLMGKIEDDINTVVLQIAFSNFERRIHGMDDKYQAWNEPKKLSVPEMDSIWVKVMQETFGEDGEALTYENMNHYWCHISHFHRPFYVYAYAFGQLLTHSLYAQRERLGDKFEPLYLDLLRAGATKNAVELLKPFGLDPTDEKFWVAGIDAGIGAMLKEAEELSLKLGVKIS